MPYILKEMLIISKANVNNKPTDDYKWNINIYQNTDIYLEIARNTEHKSNEVLKSVKIEDIQITSNEKYTPQAYIPAGEGTEMFNYTDESKITNQIEYTIENTQNIKERKLTTEGGILALSICIPEIGTYQGNDDKITYDGTLLNKIGITKEQINTNLKFNLIIETESNKTYKAEIDLNIPQEDITQTGINKVENIDLTDIVFKRIN